MSTAESAGQFLHKAAGVAKDGLIRRGKALRSAVSAETVGFGLIQTAEEIRTWFVNPQSSMYMRAVYGKEGKPLPLPTITPGNAPPILYDVLSHMGDFWEGYFIPYVIHNLSTILLVEVSPKVRLAISIGVADAIITMHEMGMFNGQQPDLADIPAGVAGSLLYLLIHNFTEKRLQEIDAKNAKLKMQEVEVEPETVTLSSEPSDTTPVQQAPISTAPSDQVESVVSAGSNNGGVNSSSKPISSDQRL